MVHAPLRMMVAGDRSSVGKSTISLGLLVALLDAGFLPHEVAYIKPATQCVSSTLVARFCEEQGIACEHIGPVVYYRGFTRQQLDNPSEHNALVAQCSEAVDRISTGKRITVIDGVGYPSVGSVVGWSSADLAVACAAPVLLVGKPGVGDAVDSFNLCARYFEAQAVPVLGSIFNRLSPSGFYSLDTCRRYLRKYMAGSRPRQRVYGMLPTHETLGTLGAEEACGLSFERPKARQRRPAPPSAAHCRPVHACARHACGERACLLRGVQVPPSAGPMTEQDRAAVAALSALFREHVDVKQLLADLEGATARPSEWAADLAQYPTGAGG